MSAMTARFRTTEEGVGQARADHLFLSYLFARMSGSLSLYNVFFVRGLAFCCTYVPFY